MDKQLINSFYQIGIEIDFENIHSFCKFTEAWLAEERDKFKTIYETKLGELTPEEKEKWDQFAIDIHWKLYDVFPILLWTSIFNSAYSLFERHLNDVCKILEKDASIKISLTDLTGKGIERAKIFLTKVIGIANVFDSTEWHEIQNYSKVRNILVHASGELNLTQKKHKEIFDYAKNHQKLIVYPEHPDSDWAKIIVLPGYIYEALIAYRILLGRICQNK
jgi:hypothetical protein